MRSRPSFLRGLRAIFTAKILINHVHPLYGECDSLRSRCQSQKLKIEHHSRLVKRQILGATLTAISSPTTTTTIIIFSATTTVFSSTTTTTPVFYTTTTAAAFSSICTMAPTYSPQAVDIALTSVLLAITILSALAATVASLSVYLLSSHIGLKIFRDDVLPLIEVHAPSQVQPGASQDKQGAPQDQGVPRTPPTERVTPDIINRVVWLTER